jgi:RNA ligase
MTEILEKVPDEFYDWVRKTEKGLLNQYNTIKRETEEVFWTLIDKKEFAEKAKKEKYQHFLFKRLNSYSTQFDEQIWDSIFPDYERPFANKIIDDDL